MCRAAVQAGGVRPPTATGPTATIPTVYRPSGSAVGARRGGWWAWAMLLVVLPLVNLALARIDPVRLAPALMANLAVVVAAAVLGGWRPGLVAAVCGALAVNFLYVDPTRSLDVGHPGDAAALALFVAVAAVMARLADRVANGSRQAERAEVAASALARGAAELVGEHDPLPQLLEQLRRTFDFDAVSLLRRGVAGWALVASAGAAPPRRPMSGRSIPLDDNGGVMVVTRGGSLPAEDLTILRAFIDQLAVALDRRELAKEAARAQRLEEADALRRGILQAVSHDLRTPLAGIKASVTSLLAADITFDEHDTTEFLHLIDTEVDRLDRVVGNLLDASRLQSGELPVQLRPHALEEVVAGALDGLAARSAEVEVSLGPEVPMVEVDGPLLERAVANIVANALAVQPAGVPVRVWAESHQGTVALHVVDAGPGIPAAERERVFEPFQRLGDRSTQAGVGLGMAIARGFTDAMGGELVLGDSPGRGLTVTFRLPVAKGPAEVQGGAGR